MNDRWKEEKLVDVALGSEACLETSWVMRGCIGDGGNESGELQIDIGDVWVAPRGVNGLGAATRIVMGEAPKTGYPLSPDESGELGVGICGVESPCDSRCDAFCVSSTFEVVFASSGCGTDQPRWKLVSDISNPL